MVGANLYFSISKQSRSFEPNNGFPDFRDMFSRLQRFPTLQGHDMIVS